MRAKLCKTIALSGLFISLFCSSLEAIIAEYVKDSIHLVSVMYHYNNQLSLERPGNLWVDNLGNLYVLDLSHQMIFIYNDKLQPLTRLGKVNGLHKPVDMTTDEEGNVYVSDADKGILVFNSIGKAIRTIDIRQITEGKVQFVTDLMIDESKLLYMATGTDQGVLLLDAHNNIKKKIIPQDILKEGSSPVPIPISRMTMDSDGKLYLLSEEIGKIYVYTDPDTFSFQFGQKGGSFGKLSRPAGIAVDASKKLIYVIDYMRHTLLIYNMDGVFLEEYGGKGRGDGWFNHPGQICLDKNRQLIVADTFNHRLQVLSIRPR
ncbi:MAG: 6-bladed beta-propeller [bacterium]